MNWLDYREKLGVGFSDENKFDMLKNRILNFISTINYNDYGYVSYLHYNNIVCERTYDSKDTETLLQTSFESTKNTYELVYKYIALYNMYLPDDPRYNEKLKRSLLAYLEQSLLFLRIQYEIIKDEDGFFIVPKGAKELDQALVTEPLEWLSGYPKSRTAFIKALSAYSGAVPDSSSDVADKFRKALETFFQEFFGGGRALEKYMSDHTYEQYLDKCGIPSDLRDEFKNTVNAYTKFINNNAKHHDKTELNVLEYIMYQTGNIIRLLIILKQGEQTDAY